MLHCLLMVKLAAFALGDEFHCVILCCGPVKTMPKDLAYDRVL
jgi:hypothetical protein